MDKTMKTKKPRFQNHEIVYVNSTYHVAEKCEVSELAGWDVDVPMYSLHSLENHGTFAATEDHIFRTKEAALKAYNEFRNKLIEEYKAEIRTLEDLLKFPLSHCFCGEEYTDYEARDAYIARLKELTNIDAS